MTHLKKMSPTITVTSFFSSDNRMHALWTLFTETTKTTKLLYRTSLASENGHSFFSSSRNIQNGARLKGPLLRFFVPMMFFKILNISFFSKTFKCF